MRAAILPSLLLTLTLPALAATPQGQAPAPAAAPQEVQRTVVVLVYDGVELGDFAAPVEVFKVASELGPTTTPSFQIRLAAEKPGPVHVDGGFIVQPDCVLAQCPKPDVLVLAGGRGALEGLKRPELIDWIRQQSGVADTVLTICLGNFLLAKAGLLDGVPVTIHKQGAGYLKYLAPKAKIESEQHYLRSGKIVTTAGFASSIDASLEVVAKYLGEERARATAEWLDHSWKPAAAAPAAPSR
jgi:transcriptional regulator GlxA family with amidase domain